MRESYTESAVGKVCLRRDGDICTIKGEVCPEHRQNIKNYQVHLIVNEEEEKIDEAKCLSCIASEGR